MCVYLIYIYIHTTLIYPHSVFFQYTHRYQLSHMLVPLLPCVFAWVCLYTNTHGPITLWTMWLCTNILAMATKGYTSRFPTHQYQFVVKEKPSILYHIASLQLVGLWSPRIVQHPTGHVQKPCPCWLLIVGRLQLGIWYYYTYIYRSI